jgi:restriction system protein
MSKSGYIERKGGTWYLTPVGEDALNLPPGELVRRASRAYRLWRAGQAPKPSEPTNGAVPEPEPVIRRAVYEQARSQARAEIEEHLESLDPYDFQQLVAELLMAMGYHVPYIAPQGRDGGIDLIAYKDPLGTVAPRIRVQVKHRAQKMTVNAIRELVGVLQKNDDIGLIVSSGGFTSDAEREARFANRHIETMDLDRLVTLWEQHYDRVSESGKRLLPLTQVFFLAPVEE